MSVEAVATAIRAGELVVLPTDTVYGLACAPYREEPVRALAAAKGRSADQPIALVAASVDWLLECIPELRGRAAVVARALLPGPYTLVLPNPGRRFPWLTGSRPDTVGVRVPMLVGPARDVLDAVNAVAATSANRHGGGDPCRLADVDPAILGASAVAIDGGELPGTPSTVLDLTGPEPRPAARGRGAGGRGSGARRRRARGVASDPMAVAPLTLEELRSAGLADVDPDIAGLLEQELERQRGEIELIASENFTWRATLEAVGSVPTNKYSEGYPGRRYYGGCEVVDEIEQLAIDRAKSLFGAEHANVQPHAGAQTNMAVYFACLQPGDTILSLELAHGGHLTHGLKVNFSGRLYRIVHYGVSRETNLVDYDDVLALAREHRPKLIVCGGSAYPRTVEAERFREIADDVGALLLCDMAHFAGLVAAGIHPSPVPHCDFVTSTTHKTLAGPRSGFVLCRAEHAQAVDRAVFPGMQGGPLNHVIAAKATCFRIAASGPFREYQEAVRANADALSEALQEGGLDVLTGGTDTHLLLVDLRRSEWSGKDAEERLAEVGITVNRNTVPFDERPPTVASGLRLGTPAATMRGFDQDDFREVGRIVCDALSEDADVAALAGRSAALCERRPLYPGQAAYPSFAD